MYSPFWIKIQQHHDFVLPLMSNTVLGAPENSHHSVIKCAIYYINHNATLSLVGTQISHVQLGSLELEVFPGKGGTK